MKRVSGKKVVSALATALFVFVVAACDNEGGSGTGRGSGSGGNHTTNTTEDLSYDLTSDCATGLQTFTSEAALCAGLQSHSRNRGCAEDLRRLAFRGRCPGTFTLAP